MTKPKTLADMSLEEREACVGMWAKMRSTRGIILGYEDGYVKLLCPTPENVRGRHALVSHAHLGLTHLLTDLPRAWGEDGQPPAGHYEEANGGWDEDVNEPYHWPMRSAACNEYCSPFDKLPAEYRRWVSKWEPTNPEPRRVNGMVNTHV